MWQQAGDDRWEVPQWTDTSGVESPRHLLLATSGGALVELHRSTCHVYTLDDPQIDPADPLAGAEYQRTIDDADVPADGTGEPVWQAMAGYAT